MKSKILAVCLAVVLTTAINKTYAIEGKPPVADFNTVISSYITSFINADYKMLDKILSEEATVKTPRAEAVISHSRANLLAQMKKENGVQQNCDFKYSVIAKSDAMVIAKVEFKYNEFTQHNYLVLEKDQNRAWKITQVCKFFEDALPADKADQPAVVANR